MRDEGEYTALKQLKLKQNVDAELETFTFRKRVWDNYLSVVCSRQPYVAGIFLMMSFSFAVPPNVPSKWPLQLHLTWSCHSWSNCHGGLGVKNELVPSFSHLISSCDAIVLKEQVEVWPIQACCVSVAYKRLKKPTKYFYPAVYFSEQSTVKWWPFVEYLHLVDICVI